MTINPMKQNRITSAYLNNTPKVKAGSKQEQASASDSIELSSAAKEYAQLVKTTREALDSADVNEAGRIQQLKDAIGKGEYNVSNEELLQSLVTYTGSAYVE